MTDDNKSIIETLLIENALTLVKLNVLTEMIIGVFYDTLTPSKAQSAEIKFKEVLKQKSIDALNELKTIVSDQKKIQRYLYDLHEANH